MFSLEQAEVASVADSKIVSNTVSKTVPKTAQNFQIVSVRGIVRATENGYRGRNTSSRESINRNFKVLVTYRVSATAPTCSRDQGLGMLIRKVTRISSSHSTLMDGTPIEVGDPTSKRGTRRNTRTKPVTVESAAAEEAEADSHRTKPYGAEEVPLM